MEVIKPNTEEVEINADSGSDKDEAMSSTSPPQSGQDNSPHFSVEGFLKTTTLSSHVVKKYATMLETEGLDQASMLSLLTEDRLVKYGIPGLHAAAIAEAAKKLGTGGGNSNSNPNTSLGKPLPTQEDTDDVRQSMKDMFWKTEYVDPRNLMQNLFNYIQDCRGKYEQKSNGYTYPYIAIFQSSGEGKSRVCKQLGTKCHVIYFSFAKKESGSIPERTDIADSISDFTVEQFEDYFVQLMTVVKINNVDNNSSFMSNLPFPISKIYKEDDAKGRLKTLLQMIQEGDFFLFQFDEARELLDASTANPSTSKFRMIRNALKECGKVLPIFATFSDTLSKITNFSSADEKDPSGRPSAPKIKLFQPFTQIDTMDTLTYAPQDRNDRDLQHLFTLGRPLWRTSYDAHKQDLLHLVNFAKQKLLCMQPIEHILQLEFGYITAAIFSILTTIQLCPQSHICSNLVGGHMATCLEVSADRHALFIDYPSEPILAEAALQILNSSNDIQSRMYGTLKENFSVGSFQAGQMGEVVAQIVVLQLMSLNNKTDQGGYYTSTVVTVRKFMKDLCGSESRQFNSVDDFKSDLSLRANKKKLELPTPLTEEWIVSSGSDWKSYNIDAVKRVATKLELRTQGLSVGELYHIIDDKIKRLKTTSKDEKMTATEEISKESTSVGVPTKKYGEEKESLEEIQMQAVMVDEDARDTNDEDNYDLLMKGQISFTHFIPINAEPTDDILEKLWKRGCAASLKRGEKNLDLIIPVKLSDNQFTFILLQIKNLWGGGNPEHSELHFINSMIPKNTYGATFKQYDIKVPYIGIHWTFSNARNSSRIVIDTKENVYRYFVKGITLAKEQRAHLERLLAVNVDLYSDKPTQFQEYLVHTCPITYEGHKTTTKRKRTPKTKTETETTKDDEKSAPTKRKRTPKTKTDKEEIETETTEDDENSAKKAKKTSVAPPRFEEVKALTDSDGNSYKFILTKTTPKNSCYMKIISCVGSTYTGYTWLSQKGVPIEKIYNTEDDAIKDFKKTFQSKTNIAWENKTSFNQENAQLTF